MVVARTIVGLTVYVGGRVVQCPYVYVISELCVCVSVSLIIGVTVRSIWL